MSLIFLSNSLMTLIFPSLSLMFLVPRLLMTQNLFIMGLIPRFSVARSLYMIHHATSMIFPMTIIVILASLYTTIMSIHTILVYLYSTLLNLSSMTLMVLFVTLRMISNKTIILPMVIMVTPCTHTTNITMGIIARYRISTKQLQWSTITLSTPTLLFTCAIPLPQDLQSIVQVSCLSQELVAPNHLYTLGLHFDDQSLHISTQAYFSLLLYRCIALFYVLKYLWYNLLDADDCHLKALQNFLDLLKDMQAPFISIVKDGEMLGNFAPLFQTIQQLDKSL